ncbi:hypothetical protein BHM03_00038226, partial [Ensete ventricosum]
LFFQHSRSRISRNKHLKKGSGLTSTFSRSGESRHISEPWRTKKPWQNFIIKECILGKSSLVT